MPSEAGSPQLPQAPQSTKPLPAVCVRLIVNYFFNWIFFFSAGGSVFLFGDMMAGKSSCDEMSAGLSE